MRRLRIWFFLIVIVSLIGFLMVRSRSTKPVETVKPSLLNVTRTLAVTGQVEAITNADISSTISGLRVVEVLADKGDSVKAGQILIKLDDSEIQAAGLKAQAQVHQSESNLLRAQAQAAGTERSAVLAAQALQDSTELKNQRDQAAASLKMAKAKLGQQQQAALRTREGARQQAVRAAQAQLKQAEIQQIQSERSLKRSRELLNQGAVSQADFEVVQTNSENASQAVAVAREQVTQLQEPRREDVLQANAVLREAEASVTGAESELQNSEKAYQNRTAAKQALTLAQTDRSAATLTVQAAVADLQQFRAALSQSEAQLQKTVLRAPLTGVITDRKIETGETAAAGQILMSIAAPRSLRIKADVDETNLHDLHVGQNAVISPDAFPDLRLNGEVAEIGAAANSERGTVEVRIRLLDTSDSLRPQLTADVNIITGTYPNALTIPRESVIDMDANPYLFVLQGGKSVQRFIKVINGDGGRAAVLQGISANDAIVLNPRTVMSNSKAVPVPGTVVSR